jgi:hypothetical protein
VDTPIETSLQAELDLSMANQEQQFLELFKSREDFCTFGAPAPAKDRPGKKGMSYSTFPRTFNLRDIQAHLAGKVSIVAIPLLKDGTCLWCCIDIDLPDAPEPRKLRGIPVYWFRSKSRGLHGFIFFEQPQKAASVREFLRELVCPAIGYPDVEIFPKQSEAKKSGSGVNLPFFGEPFDFDPEKFGGLLPEPLPEEQGAEEGDGYWSDEALLAMLAFYKQSVPGFDFAPLRGGYAVPCPGHVECWGDGERHSVRGEELSVDTIVFLKNSWPVFMCLHAHCNGGCGKPKKTIRDWFAFWDPSRLWDVGEWLDEKMDELNQRMAEGCDAE